MLCHFCLFFKRVLGVFNSPVVTPAHGLVRVQPESSITIYVGERELVCFVYLRHRPTMEKVTQQWRSYHENFSFIVT